MGWEVGVVKKRAGSKNHVVDFLTHPNLPLSGGQQLVPLPEARRLGSAPAKADEFPEGGGTNAWWKSTGTGWVRLQVSGLPHSVLGLAFKKVCCHSGTSSASAFYHPG